MLRDLCATSLHHAGDSGGIGDDLIVDGAEVPATSSTVMASAPCEPISTTRRRRTPGMLVASIMVWSMHTRPTGALTVHGTWPCGRGRVKPSVTDGNHRNARGTRVKGAAIADGMPGGSPSLGDLAGSAARGETCRRVRWSEGFRPYMANPATRVVALGKRRMAVLFAASPVVGGFSRSSAASTALKHSSCYRV